MTHLTWFGSIKKNHRKHNTNENIRQSLSRKCSSTVAVIFGGGGGRRSKPGFGGNSASDRDFADIEPEVRFSSSRPEQKKTRIIGWFKIIKGCPPFVFVSLLFLEDLLVDLKAFWRAGLPTKGSNKPLKKHVEVYSTASWPGIIGPNDMTTPCHCVTMSFVIMAPCYYGTMSLWHHVICHYGTMLLWHNCINGRMAGEPTGP